MKNCIGFYTSLSLGRTIAFEKDLALCVFSSAEVPALHSAKKVCENGNNVGFAEQLLSDELNTNTYILVTAQHHNVLLSVRWNALTRRATIVATDNEEIKEHSFFINTTKGHKEIYSEFQNFCVNSDIPLSSLHERMLKRVKEGERYNLNVAANIIGEVEYSLHLDGENAVNNLNELFIQL